MKMLSFLGETPTAALQKAQKECGPDAVVLSTKKISSKGKNSENMYEITVALEEDYDNAKGIPTQTITATPKKNSIQASSVNENISVNVYDFKAQIEQMQNSLSQVQKALWEPKSRLYDLNIPQSLWIFILCLNKMSLTKR